MSPYRDFDIGTMIARGLQALAQGFAALAEAAVEKRERAILVQTRTVLTDRVAEGLCYYAREKLATSDVTIVFTRNATDGGDRICLYTGGRRFIEDLPFAAWRVDDAAVVLRRAIDNLIAQALDAPDKA
jgi:hypothetical protein